MIPARFSSLFSCIAPFGLRMDDFEQLRRICLFSDLRQSLQRYRLCRDSCWLLLATNSCSFEASFCSSFTLFLELSKASKSISTKSASLLTGLFFAEQQIRHFFLTLPVSIVIWTKSGCDVTDKCYGRSWEEDQAASQNGWKSSLA